jgi:hypothetical protein
VDLGPLQPIDKFKMHIKAKEWILKVVNIKSASILQAVVGKF